MATCFIGLWWKLNSKDVHALEDLRVGTVLIREVSLFQRQFSAHLYVAGKASTVLIREVPLFQRYSSLVHISM